jgi:hypothetical protein|tara:strand:- start:23186 stop:23509 length:324 start_codon:yes stop_codon:yes gene_type:complete
MKFWKLAKSSLRVAAALLVMFNLLGMVPAFAAPSEQCQTLHDAHAHDPADLGTSECCGDIHCCPMLPTFAEPGLPLVLGSRPESFLQIAQPLVLIRPIDPPPRTPSL